MAKRRAIKDLNHDNWDQEDSDEGEADAGAFDTASKEQIATRKIAVAKRRNPAGSTNSSGGTPLFAGFAGFGAPTGAPKIGGGQQTPLFGFGASSGANAAAKATDTPKAPQFNFTASKSTTEPKPLETPKVTAFGGFGTQFSTSTPLSTVGSNIISRQNGNGEKQSEQGTAVTGANSKKQKTAADGDEQFRADLKALNESVVGWCQQHIAENPYVDLTPVFKDYFGHMEELDKQYMNAGGAKKPEASEEKKPEQKSEPATKPAFGTLVFGVSSASNEAKSTTTTTTTTTSTSTSTSTAAAASTTTTSPFANIKFGTSGSTSSAKEPLFGISGSSSSTKEPLFGASGSSSIAKESLFGASAEKKSTSSTAPAPLFSFTQTPATGGGTESTTPLFLFGQSAKGAGDGQKPAAPTAPFSFKATGATDSTSAGAAQNAGDDDDDAKPYEPPKAELVENEEPDAIFSMKCKLFFMKDGTYVEKGVGTFHLKPLEGSSKTQVLIRAATTTGTVLLNVSLSSKMPTQRVGKNNVSLVCVPHPPLDPKHPSGEPATLLVRVKTGDDADKMLAMLEERKKLAD